MFNMKCVYTALRRVLKAFLYSCKGLFFVSKTEVAFRQELVLFVIGTLLCFFLPLSRFEKAVLFFSLFLILLMELVNSAIETVVDRISIKYNYLSGRAKDIGSSLVLMAFANAIIIWILILS